MTFFEVFGDWERFIDKNLLVSTLNQLDINKICPENDKVFKAFQLTNPKDVRVIMQGYDPYPQKGIATGILFGNSIDTPDDKLSPSLKVIKEAAIDYTITHIPPIEFDNSLESWCRQGVLMLNSALTCEINKVGSHTMIWRPFITKFLQNFSKYSSEIVYVLFGQQAQTFEPYINKDNFIIKENHPAYYARTNTRMSSDIFYKINNYLKKHYNERIEWYKDNNVTLNYLNNYEEIYF